MACPPRAIRQGDSHHPETPMKVTACILLLIAAHQLPLGFLAAICFAVGCIGLATLRPED